MIFRRAEGERVAHNKRKTPVKIAKRLQAHLARWRAMDQGLRYIVHYQGLPIVKPNRMIDAKISTVELTNASITSATD